MTTEVTMAAMAATLAAIGEPCSQSNTMSTRLLHICHPVDCIHMHICVCLE